MAKGIIVGPILDQKSVIESLKKYIAKKKLRWVDVVAKAGVSKGTVRDLVHNKRKFKYPTLHKIWSMVNEKEQVNWKTHVNCYICYTIFPRDAQYINTQWRCGDCRGFLDKLPENLEKRRLRDRKRRARETPDQKLRRLNRAIKDKYKSRYGELWKERILTNLLSMEAETITLRRSERCKRKKEEDLQERSQRLEQAKQRLASILEI